MLVFFWVFFGTSNVVFLSILSQIYTTIARNRQKRPRKHSIFTSNNKLTLTWQTYRNTSTSKRREADQGHERKSNITHNVLVPNVVFPSYCFNHVPCISIMKSKASLQKNKGRESIFRRENIIPKAIGWNNFLLHNEDKMYHVSSQNNELGCHQSCIIG